MAAKRADTGSGCEVFRLGQPGARPGPRKVALVPGAEVPVLALDLPAGLRGLAREQVARRQIRDRLGLDESGLVMRPFAPEGIEAWQQVLVASPERIAAWRGTDCRAVLPDYLALPAAGDVWTLTAEDGTLVARLGLGDGFSAALPVASAMLRAALRDESPKAVLRLGALSHEIEAMFAAADVPVVETPQALERLGLAAPRRLDHGELDLDLRRDPQAARARLRRRLLPWRWPLLFAVCAAGLWAAAQVLAIRDIESRTRTIEAATRALTVRHFVPSGPLLDIRSQVARVLAEARAPEAGDTAAQSPLDLLGEAAEVIAMRRGVETEMATFNAVDGLTLVLRLPDFATVEAVAADLRSAGLTAVVTDSRVSEARERVRAEIRIARGAP